MQEVAVGAMHHQHENNTKDFATNGEMKVHAREGIRALGKLLTRRPTAGKKPPRVAWAGGGGAGL